MSELHGRRLSRDIERPDRRWYSPADISDCQAHWLAQALSVRRAAVLERMG